MTESASHSPLFPGYLSVPADRLGADTAVAVTVVADMDAIAVAMANAMFEALVSARQLGKDATLIVPVGPVDQYPPLAERINREQLDCRGCVFVAMDEYLDAEDRWIDVRHPLSFRGYLNRKFYDLVDPALAPVMEHRVAPDPEDLEAIGRLVSQRGGVDAVFGGIGINGHIAFNEPEHETPIADFATHRTRKLDITPHTRTINAHTIGGEIDIVPHRAVTVGMEEILGAERLRFFCNRTWQSAVVRRALHGPVTSACPASFLQTHSDATLTVARYVAEPPDIRLR